MKNRIRIISTINLITGNSSNGTIKLQNPLNGTYIINEFYMTNSFYTVNNNNNKIYFTESNVLKTATLTNGFYTSSQLATQIQTQMNSASRNTYTVILNSNTYQYTFSSTANFGFKFGTNTISSAYKLLGFDTNDYSESTSTTSVNIIDLNSIKGIYIDFHDDKRKDIEFSNNNNPSNVFSLTFNDKSDFGSLLSYKVRQNYIQKLKFVNTISLKFKLYDQDFNDLTTNGLDWYLTLHLDE